MTATAPDGMVLVPAGPFVFGSEEFGRETPQRRIEVEAFYIDRFPVTNEDFVAFVDDTGHEEPAGWQDGRPMPDRLDHPVMVNWEYASAYAAWVGKRLPTEIEWEKAARGTDGRRFPWGDTWDAERALTWETAARSDIRTEPVDVRPSGASPYGCEQMVGLLEEWVDDWYDAYPDSDYSSQAYGTRYKVLRGGAWIFTHTHARCAYRCFELPDRPLEEMATLGAPTFRCVADAGEGDRG